MMYSVKTVKIKDIIPQQQYLSVDKYNKVKEYMSNDKNEIGDIFVIYYKDKIFSVDGHHRLFYLFEQGVEEIDVINELVDNNSKLYQKLADEALSLGLQDISSLKNRFIDNHQEYVMKWVDKCQLLLLNEEEVKRYKSNPCRYSALPLYKEIRLNNNDILVVHEEDLQLKQLRRYKSHKPYFRLYHNLKDVQFKDVEGYEVKLVDPLKDIEEVTRIINESYVDISIDKKKVKIMMKDRVYDPSLWIFIIDKNTLKKVGLGISHYDSIVNELELDWIQVLPTYRGKGLGRMIVDYTLKNAPKDALFATVSGEAESEHDPRRLYESCGFFGDDLWHVFKGKKEV